MKTYYLVQWKLRDNFENHGFFPSAEEAFDSIRAWWDLNDFKPPYIRSITNERGFQAIDYGSHVSFYYIIPVTKETYAEYLYHGINANGMNLPA